MSTTPAASAASQATKWAKFNWEDPLLFEDQISDDERMEARRGTRAGAGPHGWAGDGLREAATRTRSGSPRGFSGLRLSGRDSWAGL